MLRNTLLSPKKLTLAIGLLTVQVAGHAFSQTTDSDGVRLEEIIVTSQKRAESLQDVPISVTTVSGEKLADAGIENLEDLTAYLPNIHFTESGISTQVRVRGIGSDNSQGFEQSVGMYIDGIYYGRAQLFRAPMMDMQRAELLRGPQSTLFGKNSIAGALNLTTAQPTDELEAKLSYSHEFENDQDEINAMVSGSITDNLRARIAVRTYEEQGYFKNTYKGIDEPNSNEDSARITLDWSATENLQFVLKAEKNTFETKGRAIEVTKDNAVNEGPNDDTNSTFAEFLSLVSQPGFEPELNYERQTDLDDFSDNEITHLTLSTNYYFDDYTLTLVTGQLEYNYTELCDCDFVAAEIIELEIFEEYKQFSQEIRITSPLGERFEWIGGLFYQDYDQTFQDDLNISADSLLGNVIPTIADTTANRDFDQSSEAWAIFGQVTWNITDQLRLTLGARYTEESKKSTKTITIQDLDSDAVISDPVTGWSYLSDFRLESEAATVDFSTDEDGIPLPSFEQTLSNTGHNISGSRDESALTPLININYDITPDMMGYASITKGFKAGGFDPRSNSVGDFASVTTDTETNPTQNFEFEEETALAVELGIKTSLADGRGELNIALYRTDYDDLQISQFDGAVGFNVGNAKETRVQGIELDGRWLLIDNLTASYGVSYLDFEYLDFKNGNCNQVTALTGSGEGTVDFGGRLDSEGQPIYELCDYSGKRGAYTPEFTFNFGLNLYQALSDQLTLTGFIDAQHVDVHNVHVNLDPAGEIEAYTIINARIGIEGDNWAIGILGKNLLNEKVVTYSANVPLSEQRAQSNTQYSFVRRPMTVALEATLEF
ncbi:MAG: iron complex outermembrane receptor protein [Lentisphaeria bacterium]|jgi:iron complex outermembrane receptor protein